MRPKTTLAAFAAGATAFAFGAGGALAATIPQLHWSRCGQPDVGFQCAEMTVPLDYAQPDATHIEIAVIRKPATDGGRHPGTLFWNPGGPGGDATDDFPAFYPYFPAQIRERMNIVSFDPRGIGRSDELRCYASTEGEVRVLQELPPGMVFPVGAAQTQQEIQVDAAFDRACARHGGPILDHMGTADVARDMNELRLALGIDRLDYWGTSYGTYLGATYANMFPRHVDHVVLDGNVDPVAYNDAREGRRLGTFMRLHSAEGAEAGLQTMLRDCAQAGVPACPFAAGSDAATVAKYRTLLARLLADPVTDDGTSYGYGLVVTTVAEELESEQPAPTIGLPGWIGIARMLRTLWRGSEPGAAPPTAVIPPFAGTTTPPNVGPHTPYPLSTQEGRLGVFCSESPNPTDPETYPGEAALLDPHSSLDGFSAYWSWISEPCAGWQGHDAQRYTGPWDRAPASRFLVIGTLGDSNTAYTSSVAMARALGGARLLTETGGGHTALLNRSACVNRDVDAFFANGTRPRVGTVCNQTRRPF